MVRFVSMGCCAQILLAAAGLSCTPAASAITLADVEVWVGSGASQAGLVIDWADGSAPAVYGYRFDASPTGEDMFRDIATARPELLIKTGGFSFGDFTGRAIFGVGLDRDADGFALDDATVFTNGIAETTTSNADGAASVDADDSYAEGWNSAYWGYYTSDGTSGWGFAPAGFTDRLVSDGQWDGWAYQPGFSGSAPSVQVPEPGAGLALTGLSLILLRRRAVHRPCNAS